MQKFIKQKELDEKLQKQLQSASNSHQRIQKFQADQAAKNKQQAKAKQRAKLEKKQSQNQEINDNKAEEVAAAPDDESTFKATYTEKRNNALYAALAVTTMFVGAGGYFGYDYMTNRYVSDAPEQIASSSVESTQVATTANPLDSAESALSKSAPSEESAQPSEVSIFDRWSDRAREMQTLKNQISKLVEENMLTSASGLIAGKVDPGEQVFGRQELIKLQGQNDKTDRNLLSIYMLVLSLEDDADRVAATLNHASIYRIFERHPEAVKTYDQAAKIAATIEDPASRIVSETAIAEHHIEYGSLAGARARYQAAKDQSTELSASPSLKTAAINYIATSEVTHGLTGDAESTAEQITDPIVREKSLLQITDIATHNKANGVTELAASSNSAEKGATGDELIDDLIEMNEQNKKKIKAAGSLLGQ